MAAHHLLSAALHLFPASPRRLALPPRSTGNSPVSRHDRRARQGHRTFRVSSPCFSGRSAPPDRQGPILATARDPSLKWSLDPRTGAGETAKRSGVWRSTELRSSSTPRRLLWRGMLKYILRAFF